MTFATVYIKPHTPRGDWLASLGQYVGLEIKTVDYKSAEASKFEELFPLKRVPALVTPNGFQLTELIAIVEYIVAKGSKPELSGKTTEERATNTRWLSFFNSDFVQAAGGYFMGSNDEIKQQSLQTMLSLLEYIDKHLSQSKYFTNNTILTADIFAFQIFAMAKQFGVDFTHYPNVERFTGEVSQHPIIKNM